VSTTKATHNIVESVETPVQSAKYAQMENVKMVAMSPENPGSGVVEVVSI
tara:strand:+ start:1037 stop:1186 length:150 start_codon:yes stop_codon:yes gene_type:complete